MIDKEKKTSYIGKGSDGMEDNLYHLNKAFSRSPLRYESLQLWQIGRMYCKGTTVVPDHVHLNCYELTIVTDGRGLVFTNGIPTAVTRGDIYLSLPCDVHRIQADPESPMKFDFFAFTVHDSCFEGDFERLAALYGSPHTRLMHDERIRPLISNAIAELDGTNPHGRRLLNSIFEQVLIYTIRGFESIPTATATDVTGPEALCYRLMQYIDTHIYSMKNLEELALVMDYSYGYLSVLFRQTTGRTLLDYYREKRMDTARLLLLENKLTVTQIGEYLNYSSPYAFSKAFRNTYGVSPSHYSRRG